MYRCKYIRSCYIRLTLIVLSYRLLLCVDFNWPKKKSSKLLLCVNFSRNNPQRRWYFYNGQIIVTGSERKYQLDCCFPVGYDVGFYCIFFLLAYKVHFLSDLRVGRGSCVTNVDKAVDKLLIFRQSQASRCSEL